MSLKLNYKPNVFVSTENLPEDEWLEWRRKGIGGSDVAAALGLSPYRTMRELYYDKIGVVPVEAGEDKSITFQIGHLLENVVAQIFAKKTGLSVYRDQTMYQHPLYPFMLADVDRFIHMPDGTTAILECKTAHYDTQYLWANDAVPRHYEMQVRHYMSVMNIDVAYIACLFSNNENGQYELVVVPDLNRNINAEINEDSKFGRGLSVCFTSRNKFAVLENNAVVSIRNLENQVTKRVNLPITNVNHIYSSCVAGQIILQTEDSLVFFDYSSGQILGTLAFCNVKKIIWDMKNSRAAVVCKRSISIINKSFKVLCTISEILSVKDAVWDDNGVVLYSTLCQLKYLLPSGEQGIVRSFDSPVYIVRVKNNTLLCFDKAAVYTRIEINPMEYLFKVCSLICIYP